MEKLITVLTILLKFVPEELKLKLYGIIFWYTMIQGFFFFLIARLANRYGVTREVEKKIDMGHRTPISKYTPKS